MAFHIARQISSSHLIVQPSDLRFDPPESYFFVSDGIIVSCGVLYALCYFFYMTRTIKDRTCAGDIEYLGLTMAYELFYAVRTTSTTFELVCFLVWLLFDVSFATTAILFAYPRKRRGAVTRRIAILLISGIAVLQYLCKLYPDDREQVTAFWSGVVLQLPISVMSVWLLIWKRSTKGHSLEIWITRYLGCYTAYGLFFWRYLNIPENWSYVGSAWSLRLIGLTLLAETIYPFVYTWVYVQETKRPEKRTA